MTRAERLRRVLEGIVPASGLEAALGATEALAPVHAEGDDEGSPTSPPIYGGLDSDGRGIIRVHGPIVSDASWRAVILDEVGFPYVTPARFGAALTAAKGAGATDLVLRISSAGGVVAVANAILMALREWRNEGGSVSEAVLEAWSASAATVVMLGASEITVGPLTEVMIHYARVSVESATAEALRVTADAVDSANNEIVRLYTSVRDLEESAVRDACEKELQMVGQAIVDFGLADRVLEVEPPDEPEPEPLAEGAPAEPPAPVRGGGSGDPPEGGAPPQIQADGDPPPDGGSPSDPPADPPATPNGGALLSSTSRRLRALTL